MNMVKFNLFISCGQHGEEKNIGNYIVEQINMIFQEKVDVFFAEKEYTAEALTDILFKKIRDCDGFIAIRNPRETIGKNSKGSKEECRNSLFVEQEIAIASFLKKDKIRVFEKKMNGKQFKKEGLFYYLLNRTMEFKEKKDIISKLKPILEQWLEIWTPSTYLFELEYPNIVIGSGQNHRNGMNNKYDISMNIINKTTEDYHNVNIGIISPIELKVSHLQPQQIYSLPKFFSNKYKFKRIQDSKFNHHYTVQPLPGNYFRNIFFSLDWDENIYKDSFSIGIYISHSQLGISTSLTFKSRSGTLAHRYPYIRGGRPPCPLKLRGTNPTRMSMF